MKKILLIFDEVRFSEGAFEFARRLDERQPVLLTGIFIPQLSYANLWSYATGMAGPGPLPLADEDPEQAEKNLGRFRNLCRENNIACKVHKCYHNFVLPELKKETRFADLLLIGSETFLKGVYDDVGSYISDALHASECPVIVVPEKFQFPERNILAYDGSASSVYALKQFAYLFPELCRQETLLVYFNEDNKVPCPDISNIEELCRQHFSNVKLLKLDMDPKKQFAAWINACKDAILISGSFGRPMLSELFRKSFASTIIAEHRLPVFIAHK